MQFIPVLYAVLAAIAHHALLWPAPKTTVLFVLLDGELPYLCAEGFSLAIIG